MGKPGLGDETDLSGEGFSVGHLTAAGHQAAPLPGVLLRIASPPKRSAVFSSTEKPFASFLNRWQEADLVDPVDQFPPSLDAGWIIPIQEPRMIHLPLSMAIAAPLEITCDDYTTQDLGTPSDHMVCYGKHLYFQEQAEQMQSCS